MAEKSTEFLRGGTTKQTAETNRNPASKSPRTPTLRFKEFEGEWVKSTLGHLIKDLQSGISVNSEDRPIYNDLEFGILKTSAVANGVFTKEENKKIVAEEISRAKLNPIEDEIIISRMNTPDLVGASGYIDKTYSNLFIPDRLWQTITYEDRCHNRWLSYFLIIDRVRYDLKSIATGTSGSMKNISKPNFLSIKVTFPSLPEQQKIGSCLFNEIWPARFKCRGIQSIKAKHPLPPRTTKNSLLFVCGRQKNTAAHKKEGIVGGL